MTAAYFMPGLFGIARRLITTMATEYVAGTHSMAFVTVPNMDVAKKIAGYVILLLNHARTFATHTLEIVMYNTYSCHSSGIQLKSYCCFSGLVQSKLAACVNVIPGVTSM